MHVPDKLARGRSSYLTHEFTAFLEPDPETTQRRRQRVERLQALWSEAVDALDAKSPIQAERYKMVAAGMSQTSVADHFGVKPHSVGESVNRARTYVREYVRARLEDDEDNARVA